ncbi:MAG TPA: adenylate/guanylate cyclase domain-containing protein [Actinomycetota bacterium]|nr:adenylate/guanylate cyclase domain-containing protein [Actinomycetota bacterium]
MPACHRCGEDNPDRARYCWNCGTALAGGDTAETRKTVTVLFTDVVGSTGIAERMDPESVRRVMSRYFQAMQAVVERHGGSVDKFIGDAVMAVFGVPVLHEDDAVRALRAAADMRGALAELNRELERDTGIRLETRTGINTGEVVTGDPRMAQTLVVGDAVNVAARLQESADPGDVLIGEETFRLARDALRVEAIERLSVKGKAEPIRAFRVIEVIPGAPGYARRMDSPMVGREGERILLQQAFDRTVRDRTCHLFTILGTAGVGKSRLANEVTSASGIDAEVLTGRCLPYGEGITFWPVVEVVRQAASLSETHRVEEARERLASLLRDEEDGAEVAERIAQVAGLAESAGETEETAWAVRRFLESRGARRPVVVVFDDLQWAEPTLLDVIEHAADWSRGSPLLLLCLARPELLEHRPTWGGGKLNATTILLEPLTEEQSTALIRNLLGSADLAEGPRARIATAAEGNPLFLEEMLAVLIDDGLLRREDGRWVATADLGELSMPSTIQALLAARLERLPRRERTVIERAAVQGKEFHLGAVAELTETPPDRLAADVQSLVRKELVRPAASGFRGEDGYQFRHILLRDAAYLGIPKEVRARLHARFAGWLRRSAGDWLPEYEEILGYHLEQAHRYLAELGRVDERGAALAREASEHLRRAGRRAFDRGDMPAATNLLQRATDLAGSEPVRLPLLIDLAEALTEVGEFRRADEVLGQALELAAEADDAPRRWLAELARLETRINTDPGKVTADARRLAERAVRFFEAEGDEVGLARAWHVLALARWNDARAADTEEALERAAAHAGLAGDRRQEAEDLSLLSLTASWGPAPVPDAIARTEAILQRAGGHRKVEAFTLVTRGVLEARRGDLDLARELVSRGRAMLRDLGSRVYAAATSHGAGQIELLAGDPAAAEREFRAGFEALETMGEKAYLSTSAGFVAEALCAQGRYEEAERFARISEETADPQDLMSQIQWRSARARVMGHRGRLDEAERLVRDAVMLADGTDFLETRADVRLALAEVLELAGRGAEAAAAIREAADLYERKGNVVSADRARAALAGLTA